MLDDEPTISEPASASDQASATDQGGADPGASRGSGEGTSSEAQAPARTPRKRASRARATRPASAPVADDGSGAALFAEPAAREAASPASTETPPAEASVDAPPEAEQKPAKRTRAPRKRTSSRAAARTESTDGTDGTGSTDGVADPSQPATSSVAAAVTEPAAESQASAPGVSTDVSSAVSTDVGTDVTPAAGAEPVDEPVAATVDPFSVTAPKAPRRRRRSTSPASEPAATTAEPSAASEQSAISAPAAAEPAARNDLNDHGAELDEQDARPIVMPLFQAPEPVAPRRRRAASRPAGPPVAPDADEQPAAEAADDRADGVAEVLAEIDEIEAVLDDLLEDAVEDLAEVEEVEDTDAETEDEDDESSGSGPRRRRRRGGRGRRGRGRGESDAAEETEPVEAEAEAGEPQDAEEDAEDAVAASADTEDDDEPESAGGSRRRRRRRRRGSSGDEPTADDPPNTVTRVRESREPRERTARDSRDEVTSVRGSTRLEAKKQRRREGREAGRKRTVITEAEFLTRRESVDRVMVVRERENRTQIGVLEDGVLVEHYVARQTQNSMVGNVYLGRVQNVLPSMEAAFVDIGKGRNAVLYAGEVNWDAAGLDGQPRRIEHALTAGEAVLVQVTKDPVGHKGARLTSQISMPGRYLVYVPGGSMTGISRKLPDTERTRLKKILREIVPDEAGVIVRTAAEGASDGELERDVARLQAQWDDIQKKQTSVQAPALLYGEPDLAIRVVRDIFNEDFGTLIVSGGDAWDTLQGYVSHVAPDLAPRLQRWTSDKDVFAEYRIDEQLAKALDRKVWLPSGGSLVIDRTEAMTVVDVNTGKFTGSGGNLEETVTKNNLEAAEEVVRQLRLRDIGGIIVVDFIDMVLELNRDLVMRRLLECLGRDRTRHQVAEVTSLGLIQMTRKRVGQGLLEVFSENCEHCGGRGLIVHDEPVEKKQDNGGGGNGGGGRRSGRH